MRGGLYLEYLLFLLTGLIIGVFSGFFGVGGGFILTPILLLTGFPPVVAISTSLLYTIGTSISGVIAHLRFDNIQWRIAFIVGISGIIATQLAHPLVLLIEKHQLDETLIPIFYLVLLAYFTFSMFQTKTDSNVSFKQKSTYSVMTLIAIGFFGGFISTTLGVGGGFVLIPLFISFLKLKPRFAVGTSLLSVFFIVSVGFLTYAINTPVPYGIGMFLIIGALIGGQLGGALTTFYSNAEIQRLLGFLYIITWFSLLLKLIQFDASGLIIMIIFFSILIIHFIIRFVSKRKPFSST